LQALGRTLDIPNLSLVGANQGTVLVGDLNLDLRLNEFNVNESRRTLYRDNWTELLPVRPDGLPPASMLRRSDQATPWDYAKPSLLDWGACRYGAGASPVGGPVAMVVDRVTGSGAAGSFPAFSTDMSMTYPALASSDQALAIPAFQTDMNYGHIGPAYPGTSDHLPVLYAL
jgi:hypothetical protein